MGATAASRSLKRLLGAAVFGGRTYPMQHKADTTCAQRVDGRSTAVKVTKLPPGGNQCPAGGQRIESGIDDNDDGREMLRMLCELHGHDVEEAADGPDGVERALEMKPDIAFVDIGLPTIDGYEVARRVRAKLGSSLRLVALSGYGSQEHRDAALAAGFDEHIAKPIDAAHLQRVLASAPKS